MMQQSLEVLQQQHQELLQKSKEMAGPDSLSVSEFLKAVAKTGRVIKSPQLRAQLRGLIRYWATFLEDNTGTYPVVQLEPFDELNQEASQLPSLPHNPFSPDEGEISQIAAITGQLGQYLSGLVDQIKHFQSSTQSLAMNTARMVQQEGEIANVLGEMRTSAQSMATSSATLARGTQELQAELKPIQGLAHNIVQLSQEVKQLIDASNDAVNVSRELRDRMDQSIQVVNGLNTRIEKVELLLSRLEDTLSLTAKRAYKRDMIFQSLTDPDEEFTKLYLRGERAEADGNREETLRCAMAIFDLVSQNMPSFRSEHAAWLGNVAINAGRFQAVDLADGLYDLALELNPEHSNNLQNYLDFIVTVPLPHQYQRAQKLVEKLKTSIHAKHLPERTLSLEAHLRSLMGETPLLIDPDTLKKFITEFINDPTRRRFSLLMNLLSEIRDYNNMNEVAQVFYSKATDPNDRYVAVRSLADALASSVNPQHEQLAIDIYRYLLSNPISAEASEEAPQMEGNLATLLYKHDYDNEAGRFWSDAYNRLPNNKTIQRAYESYLLRAGRPDLASDVAEGKPLKETVLQESTKQLPERFPNEDIDRWWEQ